jgi:CcmD family protein
MRANMKTMKQGIISTVRAGLSTLLMAMALLALPSAAAAFNDGSPNFQLIVVDSSGHARPEQAIELLVELTTGDLKGMPQYAETHSVKTDANGVAAIAIGFGKATDPKYVFDNFDIAQGDNFARIMIQEAGGWRLLVNTQIPNIPKVRGWLFADEKSNTVIAVMTIVWLGIVVYLFLAGRKMRQLEKQVVALKQRRGA